MFQQFTQLFFAHIFKIALTGICLYSGGWLGGGIGLLVGGLIDYKRTPSGGVQPRKVISKLRPNEKDNPNDFILSTLLLAGVVIKVDDTISDLELGYLRRFFSEQFGESNSLEYLAILKKACQTHYDLEPLCMNIQAQTLYETRLQILYILLGISHADFEVTDSEIAIVRRISNLLQITTRDFDSINAMFSQEMADYYRILEVSPLVSDEDLTHAFEDMSIKYHPDKIKHLGEVIATTAALKFKKVQEAYDTIRKERKG